MDPPSQNLSKEQKLELFVNMTIQCYKNVRGNRSEQFIEDEGGKIFGLSFNSVFYSDVVANLMARTFLNGVTLFGYTRSIDKPKSTSEVPIRVKFIYFFNKINIIVRATTGH